MYRSLISTSCTKTFPGKICKFRKLALTPIHRNYSGVGDNKSNAGRRIVFILGFTVAAGGGTILYIRSDPTAQKFIKDYIPGSQDFLQLINKDLSFYSPYVIIDDVKKSLTNLYDKFVGSNNDDKSTSGLKSTDAAVPSHIVGTSTKPKSNKAENASKPSEVSAKKETDTKTGIQDSKENRKPNDAVSSSSHKVEDAKELDHKEPSTEHYGNETKQKHKDKDDKEKKQKHKDKGDKSEEKKQKHKDKGDKSEEKKQKKQEKILSSINKDLEKIELFEKQIMIEANNVTMALKDYQEKIVEWIDASVVYDDDNSLKSVSDKVHEKELLLSKVENAAKKALKKLEKLQKKIEHEENNIDEEKCHHLKEICEKKMKSIVNLVSLVNFENSNAYLTDTYYKSITKAKEKLANSLGIAFPELSIESLSDLSDHELDLFVIYAYRLVNFYQKELEKQEAFKTQQLNKIYETEKQDTEIKVKELVKIELETERRKYAEEIIKNEFKLKRQLEKDRQKDLKRLIEEFDDYIGRVVELKDKEIERKLRFAKDETIETLKINYNRQLSQLIGKLKGLEQAIIRREVVNERVQKSQFLWNSCQNLMLTIKNGTSAHNGELKPLDENVKAISSAVSGQDELVNAVLDSVPKEAVSRGIYSELALRDRFLKVERAAYHLAGIPDGRVSLTSLFWSYLQSLLIFKPLSIPPAELANKPIDPASLSNYDVLYRARYWVDRGEYLQAVRYMNLLKGAARTISQDWLNEMRIFLEMQQAANTLLLYAIYSSQLR